MEFIRDSIVGELGYGLQKRVDLGRALAPALSGHRFAGLLEGHYDSGAVIRQLI